MAINTSMPSINNFLKGFQDGLPGMKDYQHASRLYLDDNFKLMPKQKFLFHVVFNTDESLFQGGAKLNSDERYQLNMLVKQCDLPKYNLSYEEKTQYNKKMYAGTRIAYEPVNITFHDDHADTVNAFWKKYYEYNIADSIGMNSDLTISNTKDDYYLFGDDRKTTKFGMDTPRVRQKPYLKGIEIFVLHKKRFTSMTLVNPVIGSFSHDNLDQADGQGIMNNTMQILYETVIYKSGIINKNNELKYHFDAGNFKGVMSNMVAFKGDVEGGHLAIPELDIALEIADNTLTIFNGQEILHGVTPIETQNEQSYRYTVVYYSLEQMWKCEPIDDEIVRIRESQQVKEKTRIDPEHKAKLQERADELRRQSQKEKQTSDIKNKK